MLNFEWPWILIASPVPFAIYWYIKPATSINDAALYTPFYRQLSTILKVNMTKSRSHSIKHFILPILIWISLLLAAGKPVWLGDPIEIQDNGRDLMMAVDLSASMNIDDMILNNRQVDRLTATKSVMDDFIKRRRGDRIGLILFGTQAYLQTPLTFDRETVRTLMNESDIGMAGSKTAIGDALGLAIKHLRKRDEHSRILILLTDGANTAGEISPTQAADIAKQENIKIYTIGLGAEAIIQRSFLGSHLVNPSADLDEQTLQEIADITGGQYFRAKDINELNKIYILLDQFEPVVQDKEIFRPRKNIFFWPLGLALLLSLIPAFNALVIHDFILNRKTDKTRTIR